MRPPLPLAKYFRTTAFLWLLQSDDRAVVIPSNINADHVTNATTSAQFTGAPCMAGSKLPSTTPSNPTHITVAVILPRQSPPAVIISSPLLRFPSHYSLLLPTFYASTHIWMAAWTLPEVFIHGDPAITTPSTAAFSPCITYEPPVYFRTAWTLRATASDGSQYLPSCARKHISLHVTMPLSFAHDVNCILKICIYIYSITCGLVCDHT